MSWFYWPVKIVPSLSVPQQCLPTHTHLCGTRCRAEQGEGREGGKALQNKPDCRLGFGGGGDCVITAKVQPAIALVIQMC